MQSGGSPSKHAAQGVARPPEDSSRSSRDQSSPMKDRHRVCRELATFEGAADAHSRDQSSPIKDRHQARSELATFEGAADPHSRSQSSPMEDRHRARSELATGYADTDEGYKKPRPTAVHRSYFLSKAQASNEISRGSKQPIMSEHPVAALSPEMHDAIVDDTTIQIIELASDEENATDAQLGTTSNKRRRTSRVRGIYDRNTPLNDWMGEWAKMGKAIRAQEKALAQARIDQARLEDKLETQWQNNQKTIDQRDELQLVCDELSIQNEELQKKNQQVVRDHHERMEASARSLEELTSASRCGVCYAVKPDLYVFPCGHVICAGCRELLLTSTLADPQRHPSSPSRILYLLEKTMCPHCRKPVGTQGQKLMDSPAGKYLRGLLETISEIERQMG